MNNPKGVVGLNFMEIQTTKILKEVEKMRYVQYYQKQDGELVEACGDRSIVILDGRNSIETSKQDAINFNGYHRPKYDGFRIRQGDGFTRSKPITNIISL